MSIPQAQRSVSKATTSLARTVASSVAGSARAYVRYLYKRPAEVWDDGNFFYDQI